MGKRFPCGMSLLPPPDVLMSLAAVGGVLVTGGILLFSVMRFFCDTLDRRFADLKADQNRRFDELKADQDRRFDELKADQDRRFDQVDRRFDDLKAEQDKRFDQVDKQFDDLKADIAALRDALLSVKA